MGDATNLLLLLPSSLPFSSWNRSLGH
uniref:Uncharacterized protein n=1 Tax=Rhizophora mucronata TaxID=61149 RepID=A0A2P2MGX3_RHIMU